MIKRIVEINHRSWLSIKNQQLCVDQDKKQVARIPVEDLGVLLLAHPAITLTQAVVIRCQQHNAVIIFCDQKHLPYSVILPISEGHSLHHKELQQQIALGRASRKRLWQQIVQCKIKHQIQTLEFAARPIVQLERMLGKVKSGDPDNLEAQAAQRYWRLLFGDTFRRDQDAEGINALLNYGYAIMRALVARAIVSSGLHPALGIHHSNQYNGLCLADDLMEPLRPWIDKIVWQMAEQAHFVAEISPETKQPFLKLLSTSVEWKNKKAPLMIASHHYLVQLKKCYANTSTRIIFPRWLGNLSDL